VQTERGSMNKYEDVGLRGGVERPESMENFEFRRRK